MEEAITTVEEAITTAEEAITTAEEVITTAEKAITTAEEVITATEEAITTAEEASNNRFKARRLFRRESLRHRSVGDDRRFAPFLRRGSTSKRDGTPERNRIGTKTRVFSSETR